MEHNKKSGIAADAAKLSFANIVSLLISLLCVMLLSRYISKFEYGTYSQLNMVSALAISVFTLGLPNSINYFFARASEKHEQQKFLQTYYLLITFVCLLAGAVLCLLLPFLQRYFHNHTLSHYIYVLLLLPLTRVIIQSNSNMLIVIKESRKLVKYTLTHNFCLLIIVFAIPMLGFDFSGYMLLYMLVQILFSAYVYYTAARIADFRDLAECRRIYRMPKLQPIKNLLLFSVPLGLGAMVSTLSLELDKLVIANLMDTDNLAIYTNAAKELPISMLVSSFTAVLLPKMSRMIKNNQKEGIVEIWGLSIEIGFSIMLFFALAIIVFAPQVIVFLYSPKYLEGLPVFVICTLILVLRSTYFGIALNVSGNTKFIFYSSIASLILNFVLNYIFFGLFGIIGPAISTVSSIAIVNALQLWYTSKILSVPIRQVFPWKSLLQILIKNLLLAMPFIAFVHLIKLQTATKDILIAIAAGAAWLLLYVLSQRRFLLERWRKLNEY